MTARPNYVAGIAAVLLAMVAGTGNAVAQKKYGPGASDSEIKVGNTGPYSGPNSGASSIQRQWGPHQPLALGDLTILRDSGGSSRSRAPRLADRQGADLQDAGQEIGRCTTKSVNACVS